MYSPLTLFMLVQPIADAYEFNKAVNKYLENRSLENQKSY
jgi:hypothetical protein